MSQKLIICEGSVGKDLLEIQPIAGYIANGYVVQAISGYASADNRNMCAVLLTEAETQSAQQPSAGEDDGEGGSESTGDNEGEEAPNPTVPISEP